MLYRIGEFSNLTDTSIRTLRYYDEIDLFKPKEIDLFTGYRYYSKDQIEDFNLVKTLQEVGFSLEEIKDNWGNFNDSVMLDRKDKLLKEMEDIKEKIRKVDYLRSNIVDGKIVLERKEKVTKEKIKTIF